MEHTWRQAGPVMLRDDERIDDLPRNQYGIIQRKGAFCFGMDAVLLSGFAVVKKGERMLDLGTGTGIIPILLTAKTEGEHFTWKKRWILSQVILWRPVSSLPWPLLMWSRPTLLI